MLRITACFIIGENLIWRFFVIRQTAKLKSSPNFPAIRYSGRGVSGKGAYSSESDVPMTTNLRLLYFHDIVHDQILGTGLRISSY